MNDIVVRIPIRIPFMRLLITLQNGYHKNQQLFFAYFSDFKKLEGVASL